MTLQELVQQAWADHESKTAEVADRLEAAVGRVEDANGAAGLMNLAIHAIGDHAKDRARARRVCEAAGAIYDRALEKADRSAADDARMETAAHAARTFWGRVGTWENAERGLETIAANGEEKVDEAFLHLARARACRDAGDPKEHAASLARAEALAADFEGDGLRTWFAGELEKSR